MMTKSLYVAAIVLALLGAVLGSKDTRSSNVIAKGNSDGIFSKL
jgi:hypothetical protein